MIHTSDRLSKVDLVGFLLLVGVLGKILMPVPTCEGVALAGGGCRLAHEALGVGHTHHGVVTVSELAAVGNVKNVDLVLLGVLNPLSIHGCMRLGDGLSEVDLVEFLLLVGQAVEAGDPVPACEGVALAGGGHGLTHVTLGIGQTLLNVLAVSELAAVGDIQHVDFVLLLVLDPLSVDGSALLNGLREIDLVGFLLLVGVLGQICMPVPAGEGVALAGGRRRLTEHAVGIGNTLHGFIAVKELTAVGHVKNVDLVLLFSLIGLVVHVKGSDALKGGGHVHFDLAGCDAGDDLLSGVAVEALDAVCNAAVCGNLNVDGFVGAVTLATLEEVHNLNALGCILLPCGKPVRA